MSNLIKNEIEYTGPSTVPESIKRKIGSDLSSELGNTITDAINTLNEKKISVDWNASELNASSVTYYYPENSIQLTIYANYSNYAYEFSVLVDNGVTDAQYLTLGYPTSGNNYCTIEINRTDRSVKLYQFVQNGTNRTSSAKFRVLSR